MQTSLIASTSYKQYYQGSIPIFIALAISEKLTQKMKHAPQVWPLQEEAKALQWSDLHWKHIIPDNMQAHQTITLYFLDSL